MSMKPEFFCCIGAELKDEIAGSLKSSRIFMYRAAESQTIADMLADGFFNDADDLRVNDLILLYCPEQTRAITYVKVSSVSGGVVKTSLVSVSPEDIPIDTTGYSNISGSNLKQVLDNIDAEFSKYLKLDGSTTMTGVLKMRASESFKCAIAPSWDGVGFFKLNNDNSVTLMASMEEIDGLSPATNNKYNLGKLVYRWKNLYLSGTAYMTKINNGFDIAVPVTNSADTLALKSQVDDAANSGEQLYTTGVWYAKMYAATVVPTGAEYDGRNYADFSQVDSDNNPVIKVYTGASGAWTLTETITPPKNHNGYMTITSKIWDIAEQSGQQGGQVLWSHNQNTFTPYPRIISFESINITGNSTVDMPLNPTANSIVNVDYLATHNGTGRNVGDIFFTARTDSELNGSVQCNGDTYSGNDFTGSQSPVALMEAGKIPYVSLSQYATLLSTNGSVGVFGWDGTGTTDFRVPSLNDIFIETGTTAQTGNYVAPGLPNITGNFSIFLRSDSQNGAFYESAGSGHNTGTGVYGGASVVGFDASRSNALYGASTTVQPKAVRYRAMVQLAISTTDEAVLTCTSVTSDVADLNAHKVIAFQAPTAGNNYTWYRKYADGWVEQGGQVLNLNTGAATSAVVFPVEFSDSNYTLTFGTFGNGYNSAEANFRCTAYSATGATFYNNSGSVTTYKWYACGMAA